MKNIFSLFLFVLANLSLISQTSVDDALDDGGMQDAKNIIKFDVIRPFEGIIGLGYERVLFDFFSTEVSFGYTPGYYLFDAVSSSDNLYLKEQAFNGFAFAIQPKFYFASNAPELNSFGPMYKQRYYDFGNAKQITERDILLNYEIQLRSGERFIFSYSAGMGIRKRVYSRAFHNDPSLSSIVISGLEDKIDLIVPFSLKIGYLLF